jgi:hypothetical protein
VSLRGASMRLRRVLEALRHLAGGRSGLQLAADRVVADFFLGEEIDLLDEHLVNQVLADLLVDFAAYSGAKRIEVERFVADEVEVWIAVDVGIDSLAIFSGSTV